MNASTPHLADQHRLSRREVIKYGGAVAAMAGLGAGLSTTRAEADTTDSESGPLVIYDMQHLYSLDLTDEAQARSAYDEMHFVATLQGIVNRDEPRLYVKFSYHDDFGAADIDGFWLSYLQQSGQFLAGRSTRVASGLDDLVRTFRALLRGAVVWDPRVWATSNVASTVAGVEDLVAIRYDTSPNSLYSRYVTTPATPTLHLPVQRWLLNPNGSSSFTGTGTIPGTSLQSTGSAKCDAYMWAKVRYLDTRLCDPGQLGYYLDGYWLTNPTFGLAVAMVTNHDYLVARRGFVVDLGPWDDESPVDDPTQPPGTDRATWQAILTSAYHGTGGQMTAIHGFVPWQYKYSSAPHNPVGAEWESVQLVSAYNAYLDADAPGEVGGMANASVYMHTPLKASYPQGPAPTIRKLQDRGLVAADGSVVPKRYVLFYVSDYDSAAWIYHAVPRFWPDLNRGAVPLSWAFNPNLSDRIAPAFTYTRASKTDNDVFIAGDSGAGYLNPSMLEAPRPYSGLPSGLGAWQRHCSRYFHLWDITVTGFIIDGNAPAMDEAGRQTYARFSTNGFAEQSGPTLGVTGTTPYLQGAQGGSLESILTGDTTRAPYLPEFHVYRNTLQSPTWYKEAVDQINSSLPDAEVAFVDALTFFAVLRQFLYNQVIATVGTSFVAVVPGQSVPVTLQLTSYRPTATTGSVSITAPTGWTTSPASTPFSIGAEGQTQITIDVQAPAGLPLGERYDLAAVVTVDGTSRSYGFQARTSSGATGTATISTTLDTANVDDGLSQVEVSGDGRTEVVAIAGETGRRMVEVVPADLNMYFDVDNSIANDGQFQATFTVDYYDESDYAWVLQYDSNNPAGTLGGAYTTAGTVTNAGTNTWKTAAFTVDDARFAGRENGATDFRVASSAGPITIHRVQVVVSGVGVSPPQ